MELNGDDRLSTSQLQNDGVAQQIVGRERRERVSQLAWCGEGCFDSRRRVNSTVMRLYALLEQVDTLNSDIFGVRFVRSLQLHRVDHYPAIGPDEETPYVHAPSHVEDLRLVD